MIDFTIPKPDIELSIVLQQLAEQLMMSRLPGQPMQAPQNGGAMGQQMDEPKPGEE